MNKICTSLEQSQKLIELGIDISTADMCYIKDKPNIGFLYEEYKEFGDSILTDYWPAWSLTGLLNILPSSTFDISNDHCYRLHCDEKFTDWYNNPIDTCMEMINRLKENGKI